jgi:hypothetical protein
VKSQGFVTITPDYAVDDAPSPDVLVIPADLPRRPQERSLFHDLGESG